eukprot:ctg_1300.g353
MYKFPFRLPPYYTAIIRHQQRLPVHRVAAADRPVAGAAECAVGADLQGRAHPLEPPGEPAGHRIHQRGLRFQHRRTAVGGVYPQQPRRGDTAEPGHRPGERVRPVPAGPDGLHTRMGERPPSATAQVDAVRAKGADAVAGQLGGGAQLAPRANIAIARARRPADAVRHRGAQVRTRCEVAGHLTRGTTTRTGDCDQPGRAHDPAWHSSAVRTESTGAARRARLVDGCECAVEASGFAAVVNIQRRM